MDAPGVDISNRFVGSEGQPDGRPHPGPDKPLVYDSSSVPDTSAARHTLPRPDVLTGPDRPTGPDTPPRPDAVIGRDALSGPDRPLGVDSLPGVERPPRADGVGGGKASPQDLPRERWDDLRLTLVNGVGPLTRRSLLAAFGSASAVLNATMAQLSTVDGVGPKLSSRLASARMMIDVADEVRVCREHGLRILMESDADYPERLRQIPDPPGVLFVAGELESRDALAVAIVGTRHATAYGLLMAERLAGGLAQAGYTVVSGLARGIDAAAHRGAMAAGGRTLAVLGSGLLNLYPPEHSELAAQVRCHGAVLSEAPPRMPAQAGMFPQRNRVITGLCLGTIVVEAAERSGALVSATHAMEQGREVFAVPGRADSRMSRGCHRLIRDGATLVESVDDVLAQFGPLADVAKLADGREVRHAAELQLNDVERSVLELIGDSPTLIDVVARQSGLPTARVLATLTILELRRLVRRPSGSSVCRV